MSKFAKPTLVVSKCLGFAACRWNGLVIADDFVDRLQSYVNFLPVCAEVEIGLGVPRDPIRVVSHDGERRLVQPATGKDVTEAMQHFSESYLSSLGAVDGFILKGRSPSCGIKDVKVYPGTGKVAAESKSSGFFGGKALEMFPDLPIEEEGRLTNFKIREHFLARIFALARLREVIASEAMRELVRFQSDNKLLLMSCNQVEMRVLGRIVANHEKRPFAEAAAYYEAHFRRALAKPSRSTSNINVLMHALGYFSEGLNAREKALFLDALERYRSERIPLSAVTSILRAWIVRFDNEYLMAQTFLNPYPEELIEVTDSGKGRL
jgi:uncharacterized protein YbgA (DUF1722 family)/uncharacterized protein YbbK (DUF523 family)